MIWHGYIIRELSYKSPLDKKKSNFTNEETQIKENKIKLLTNKLNLVSPKPTGVKKGKNATDDQTESL